MMLNRRRFLAAAVTSFNSAPMTRDAGSFGAVGDGVHDDTQAIQSAINAVHASGGGVVALKSTNAKAGSYWRLTKPLILRSNVRLVGSGPDTILYNDRLESQTFMDQAVILPGNYHPAFLNELPYDGIVQTDRRDVFKFTVGPRNRYVVGQSVFLRTSDVAQDNVAVPTPAFCRIGRILYVDEHSITIDVPIDEVTVGLVSPADEMVNWRTNIHSIKCFVSLSSSIENLSVRSHGAWIGDSAARNFMARNVWIDSSVGIYGNLFQDSIWDNIHCTVFKQPVELSCTSMNVMVSNFDVVMTRYPNGFNSQLIAIQEGSRNCVVRNFVIKANVFAGSGAAIRFGPSSKCKIQHGLVYCENARGALFSFDTIHGVVQGNECRDVTVFGGKASLSAYFGSPPTGNVLDNTLVACTSKNNNLASCVQVGGSSNKVVECELDGSKVEFLPDAEGCVIDVRRIKGRVVAGNICEAGSQKRCNSVIR